MNAHVIMLMGDPEHAGEASVNPVDLVMSEAMVLTSSELIPMRHTARTPPPLIS